MLATQGCDLWLWLNAGNVEGTRPLRQKFPVRSLFDLSTATPDLGLPVLMVKAAQ